jgi:hypothetical protein
MIQAGRRDFAGCDAVPPLLFCYQIVTEQLTAAPIARFMTL